MLESDIVAHCAPTLAGIKTANMFNYLPDDMEKLHQEIQEENCKLNSKGVYVEILRTGEKRALIYVYRKNRLEADLNRKGAESILQTCGYECGETDCCLRKLQERFFSMNVFRMRWDCFWVIRWMMWQDLLNRREKITSAVESGRFMEMSIRAG